MSRNRTNDRPLPDQALDHAPVHLSDDLRSTRRGFLRAGLGAGLGAVLAGCQAEKVVRTMPGPPWSTVPLPTATTSVPVPVPPPVAPYSTPVGATYRRSQWARGQPVPSLMDGMKPIRYITIHHDGMSPFYGNDGGAGAARLEAIRVAHRRESWGDIGYHFAVDRAGNVWEARPLVFQGAHVKNHNEGNIGIVALGNFDLQRPTDAQRDALHHQVRLLMTVYGVPLSGVKTHMEWAATACPGRRLQEYMVASRTNGSLA